MADDVDLARLEPDTMIEGPMWNGPAMFIQVRSKPRGPQSSPYGWTTT